MTKYCVLFNPLSGHADCETVKNKIAELLSGCNCEFFDITGIDNLDSFISSLEKDERIVIAGGDGTVNKFVNLVDCDNLNREIYLFPAGNGNDFYADLGTDEKVVRINPYIKNLPTITVNGKTYKFINGVGYGIDGYCCEVGDKLKAEGKKVNYTSIAIKGLLFHFKPKNATVTVDGKSYNFKKTWIAPTMNGRMYGGGMIPTPAQNRTAGKGLSVCVMHGKGRLKTLMAFPSIFKGEHVKKEKIVKILEGREITVKFDSPCALQIDGETILGVSEYSCSFAAEASMEKAA